MLHLTNAEVEKVLDMGSTLQALREGYQDLERGDAAYIPRIDLFAPTGRPDDYYRWGSMAGVSRTLGVVATRIKSDVVSWPGSVEDKYCMEPGTYSGIILLYAIVDGEPLAIIQDGYIQHMRVGGAAGLGTEWLSKKDSHVLGLIGTGGMAHTYLDAICRVRDITEARVFSRTAANREAFAEESLAKLGIHIEPVESAEAAVRGADIVATATNSTVPTFEAEWLSPGAHIVNVTGRELSREVIARADIKVSLGYGTILGDQPGMSNPGGGLCGYLTGQPDERSIVPEANARGGERYPVMFPYDGGEVPAGRTSDEQITLFSNGGTQGLQFASVAGRAFQLARDAGIGTKLPTELFLQDIRD